MKTVPTVRLADSCDDGVFSELPEQVQLALTDFAGPAREGLLAMSVGAGLSVMQAMLEAEIAAACGPKGKHDPGRTAVRHGSGKGSVTLGGSAGAGGPAAGAHPGWARGDAEHLCALRRRPAD